LHRLRAPRRRNPTLHLRVRLQAFLGGVQFKFFDITQSFSAVLKFLPFFRRQWKNSKFLHFLRFPLTQADLLTCNCCNLHAELPRAARAGVFKRSTMHKMSKNQNFVPNAEGAGLFSPGFVEPSNIKSSVSAKCALQFPTQQRFLGALKMTQPFFS